MRKDYCNKGRAEEGGEFRRAHYDAHCIIDDDDGGSEWQARQLRVKDEGRARKETTWPKGRVIYIIM